MKPARNTVCIWYDRAAAKRTFEAMMQMTKIDIAVIEAARFGNAKQS